MPKTDEFDGSSALTEKQLRIITIEATEQPQDVYLRVAAYTRVSSASDDQLNSFGAQNRYYTEYISKNPRWKLVDIYADEGITGTSIEKREDFKRMIADCDRGLIDRILVKSISRFARNTTECLETIRKLKAKGIGVHFEKEGIDTSKVSGEMLTAVFASLAQAESESISKNIRWSYQKRMESGQFVPPYLPYGFRRSDNSIEICEEEAVIVRRIFYKYVSGVSFERIAQELNIEGIPFYKNGESKLWSRSTIGHIVSNEKYYGSSLWQKSYTLESLPHTQRANRGEAPQYYAEGTHQAILDKSVFLVAQALRRKRKLDKHTDCYYAPNPLRKKIVCGECGSSFRIKTTGETVYWSCKLHMEDKRKCSVRQISQNEISNAFLRLYCKLKQYGLPILFDMLSGFNTMRNRRMLWSTDVIEINKRISDNLSQNQMLTTLKQKGLVDPDIFISKSNELTKQLRELKQQKEGLLAKEDDDKIKQTRAIMDVLDDGPDFIDTFDAELFGELIDKIIVESNTHLRFRLKNGLELREQMERPVR